MIVLDALALPVVVSFRHTSGGMAHKQGQRKKDNPTRLSLSAPSSRPRGSSQAVR